MAFFLYSPGIFLERQRHQHGSRAKYVFSFRIYTNNQCSIGARHVKVCMEIGDKHILSSRMKSFIVLTITNKHGDDATHDISGNCNIGGTCTSGTQEWNSKYKY